MNPLSRQAHPTAQIMLVGVNAWLVCSLIPTLHRGANSSGDWLWPLIALTLLSMGLFKQAKADRHADQPPSTSLHLRASLLLVAFPLAIAVAIARRDDFVHEEIFGPAVMVLSTLSMLTYTGLTARILSIRPQRPNTEAKTPRHQQPPIIETTRTRWLRRLLILGSGMTALATITLPPTLTTLRQQRVLWGDAAQESLVLTVTCAGVLSSGWIAFVVGPGLRKRKRVRTQSRSKTMLPLLVAILGATAWLSLRMLETPSP